MEESDFNEKILVEIDSHTGYNKWIYANISEYIGERIFEVGCGIGNITQFLKEKEYILCLDRSQGMIKRTKKNFSENKNISFLKKDLLDVDAAFLSQEKFDTVLCINVLEHILDDERALKKMHEIVAPGGNLVLLVPAIKSLYGESDKSLSHHRRYTKKELLHKVKSQGFVPQKIFYMNLLGVFGWLINGRILKRKSPSRTSLKIFAKIEPILVRLEKAISIPFGLSLICVGEKPKNNIL
ncbi:MAG: methyltransferase [Candidatus Altiarchaeota archaeon]